MYCTKCNAEIKNRKLPHWDSWDILHTDGCNLCDNCSLEYYKGKKRNALNDYLNKFYASFARIFCIN